MIITITGKPFSKKSEVAEIFSNKYDFDYLCSGELFKKIAKENKMSLFELSKSNLIKKYDSQMEQYLINVYQTMSNTDTIVESKTAWSFMQNAFNVYIDVDKTFIDTIKDSNKDEILQRYNNDINRFKDTYNIDCTNINNYTFVINSTNLTAEETADAIYQAYLSFTNK